jgi:beta-xylosidase
MGTYYLMTQARRRRRTRRRYATSKSPLGPFERYASNPIAHRGHGVFGPGHHCVVTGPDGKLWMVYHQQNTDRPGWDRFLAIDPLRFDDNGVIHTKTTRGTDEPAPKPSPSASH